MHSSRQPRLLGSVLVLFLLILVAFVSRPDSAAARTKAKAKVTWQPTALEVSLLAGTSTVREAVFTSTGDIDDVSFFVTPELAPYLSIETYGIGAIKGDTLYSALLVIDVPPSTPEAIYEGTIHLRGGNRTIPQTLKVVVNISLGSGQEVPDGISLPSSTRIVQDVDGTYSVNDEIIVGLNRSVSEPETIITQIASETGASILGSISETHTFQLQYPVHTSDELEEARLALLEYDSVTFASHHYLSSSLAATYPYESPEGDAFDTWSQAHPEGNNWNLEFVKAPSAWDISTGNNVRIAVVDYGMHRYHEDLTANLEFVDGPVLPAAYDLGTVANHGMHISGTICADGFNGVGIAGMSWRCSLRLYNLGGIRYVGYIERYLNSALELQEMMTRAANDGAQVVNLSLAVVDPNKCLLKPTEATIKKSEEANDILGRAVKWAEEDGHDVLWVIAAGNECRDISYQSPASLVMRFPENVVTVANIGKDGNKAFLSNFGSEVSVAAPGEQIFSTLANPCEPDGVCRSYGTMSGTSMAAPHVSGLASLVWSSHPEFTAAQVKDCIVKAAEMYGPQVPFHEFHVISAPEAVLCDFPETPTLQRIEVHGRSMSDNGRYVVHDASERRVPQLDTNFHTDIYMYDLLGPNPGDNPVLASVSVNGIAGNLASRLRWDQLAVSNSGRVVFQSGATDLVAGDTNRVQDIFIRDFSVEPPVTVQVSVRSDGTPNRTYYDMPALNPSISTDGRYAVFESDFRYASMAWYGISDIYLRDIDDSSTYLVSQNRENPLRSGNADSTGGLVSPNGEVVVFNTLASDIGMGITDNNGLSDVYLYDIAQGQVVERISVGNDGSEANGNSVLHSISRDGRFVLFYSTAQGLEVDGGSNSGNYYYLYLRDRDLQTTTEIDKIWNGYDLSRSRMVRISGDGRYLAFWANQWTPGHSDVLLWEHESDVITRLSQGYDFIADVPVEPSNGSSMIGFINNDTQIAFLSAANNLVPDDDNGEVVDLFIYTIP